MRHLIVLSLLGLSLTGCSQASISENPVALHPLVGCWENDTALEREGWTSDPSGWLIGYAASRDIEGNVTFFEHMRLERGDDSEVLVVTGQDNSETRFTRRKTEDSSEFRFENPAHDYPQIIVYRCNSDALNAYIALMDGTKKVSFDKTTCSSE